VRASEGASMAHFGMVSLCSTDLGFLGSERVKPLSESQPDARRWRKELNSVFNAWRNPNASWRGPVPDIEDSARWTCV